MVLHQFFANSFVRLGGAEKHAVRHDTGALTTLSQHPQEQGQKQQLGLFGVGHGFQVVVDAFRVHGALERRICQTHGKLIADLILLGNTVLVVDLRVADGGSIRFIAEMRSMARSVSKPVKASPAKCSHCSKVLVSS